MTDSKLIFRTIQTEQEIPLPPAAATQRLTEILRREELPLNTRCGQRGLCDGCLIDLIAGQLIHMETGESVNATDSADLLQGCKYRVAEGQSATVFVPARSLLAHRPQVVTSFRVDVSRAQDPLWQTMQLRSEELTQELERDEAICQIVSQRRDHDLPVRYESSSSVPSEPATAELTISLDGRDDYWSAAILDAQDEQICYGAAIDVGTTTVVVMLIELATGRIAATSSELNAQTRLGDNVLTRINLCLQNPNMISRLQQAIVRRTLRPLLEQVLHDAGVSIDQLKCMAIAGNTTMLHLVAGIDPGSLGTAPFTPVFVEHRILRAKSLGILPKPESDKSSETVDEDTVTIAADTEAVAEDAATTTDGPDPTVHLLPSAAAYVGSDIIAGVFSTGMAYRDETCLLVDVGTNGEIVLKHGDRFLACATAAGPAFEGSGLICGMRASRGAISHVRLKDDNLEPWLDIIGDEEPIGVCGTAYVDFIAEARQRNLIGPTGRFSEEFADHPRIGKRENRLGFELARAEDDKPVEITEGDIASLMQAKAAIAAGIVCLLERVGLSVEDVTTLYLAGGFGFHMNLENVIRCGLLPGFRLEQIELVGNTSLAGAYLALMDSGVLAQMKRISQQVETIELNLEPEFESRYIDQLILP